MNPLPDLLDSPAAFDAAVYLNPETARAHALAQPEHVNSLARQALASFVENDLEGCTEWVEQLRSGTGPLDSGVRLILLTLLGQYEAVAQQDVLPTGADTLSLEGACHGATAVGVAAAQHGQLQRAGEYLRLALGLSTALGMTNRTQMLTVESSRVALLRGEPRPQPMRDQLMQPMTPRRRHWTQRTLAETLMAQGGYEEALQVLGLPEEDGAEDSGLRAFLHTLLGLPPHAPLDTRNGYAQMACALQDHPTSRDTMAAIRGDPQMGYAAIIEASMLGRSDAMRQQVIRVLGRRPMVQADQQLYRALTLVGAVANGAHLHAGALSHGELPLSEQFCQALGQMHQPREILGVVRRLSARYYTLMAFSHSNCVPMLNLSSVPLLTGKIIIYGGQEFAMPGRTGRTQVLEALDLPHEDLNRAERRRLAATYATFPMPVVNVGWIARACQRLAAASKALGQANEAARWTQGYEQARATLTACVREEMKP